MAHFIYYYDKTGRRYEGKIRKCFKCGKEEIIRANNTGLICQSCIRPYRDVVYYSKGKKYPGRKRVCRDCGKESLIRLTNKAEYCELCRGRHTKSCVRNDEIFVDRGRCRSRAKKIACTRCKKIMIVRNDSTRRTTLCLPCSKFKTGEGIYRNIAYKFLEKKCAICNTLFDIHVHHRDNNRKNNDISNLLPLCNYCHMKIHRYLKSGKTEKQAIGLISMRNKLKNNTNSQGIYISDSKV